MSTSNNNSSDCDAIELSNFRGCFIGGTTTQLSNLISAIFMIILSVFIFISNTITLIFYMRFKNDSWNFLSFCVIELLFYNILISIHCVFNVLGDCFFYNNVFCIIKFCLNYFIFLMTFKVC